MGINSHLWTALAVENLDSLREIDEVLAVIRTLGSRGCNSETDPMRSVLSLKRYVMTYKENKGITTILGFLFVGIVGTCL